MYSHPLVSFHRFNEGGILTSWTVDDRGQCSGDVPNGLFVELHTRARDVELWELRTEKAKVNRYLLAAVHIQVGWERAIARGRAKLQCKFVGWWRKVQLVVRRAGTKDRV